MPEVMLYIQEIIDIIGGINWKMVANDPHDLMRVTVPNYGEFGSQAADAETIIIGIRSGLSQAVSK